ncbi:hypothetical protein HRH25_03135 [Flavisolibacter sp. BT320]|nr:hypothetical protein [Flavisolibacter longurius]
MERIMRITMCPVWITVLLAACNTNPSSEAVAMDKELVKGIAATQDIKKEKEPFLGAFPVDGQLPMKILSTGTFHEEEVWEGAEKEAWMGLFKGGEGYYLAPASVQATKVFDPLVDEDDSEKTGWQVTTSNPDNTILLMEAQLCKRAGSVQALPLSKDVLYPGDSLPFSYGGENYVLFATGETGKEAPDVKNYKLYLSSVINKKKKTTILTAQPSFDDRMIRLLFIGDLDGDKKPDLLIDTSPHYNMQKPTLYLSGAAGKDEIIKPVAAHRFVGC